MQQLRYVDADKVGSEVVNFDDMKVRTPDGDKLGEVDGFIVDHDVRRAFYVVVDSGGWFTSRKFLVPIGHARIDEDGDALVLDVNRDTISRYPEFDQNSFERLGDAELRAYEHRFGQVCCPDDAVAAGDWNYDSYRHYQQPAWWRTEYYNWDVPAAVGTTGTIGAAPSRPATFDDLRREPAKDARDREHRRAGEGGDVSPHPGGRAQPGDVLGVETGGERTYLGDDDEKENERRRQAERARKDSR